MAFRCDIRPVDKDAGHWAALLFGRSDHRALRLCRLRGFRLAQSMTAELLCRDLLAELAPGMPFLPVEDESGKPRFSGCPLQFSISHSGDFVAGAVSDKPVGIDLQELRSISDRVLGRLYSPEERRWIGAGPITERAIRLWTMKEAYGKLLGTGIFRDPRFCAVFEGDRLVTRYDGFAFHFPEAPEGLLLSVCLSDPSADA